jgi:hypothetical protein
MTALCTGARSCRCRSTWATAACATSQATRSASWHRTTRRWWRRCCSAWARMARRPSASPATTAARCCSTFAGPARCDPRSRCEADSTGTRQTDRQSVRESRDRATADRVSAAVVCQCGFWTSLPPFWGREAALTKQYASDPTMSSRPLRNGCPKLHGPLLWQA